MKVYSVLLCLISIFVAVHSLAIDKSRTKDSDEDEDERDETRGTSVSHNRGDSSHLARSEAASKSDAERVYREHRKEAASSLAGKLDNGQVSKGQPGELGKTAVSSPSVFGYGVSSASVVGTNGASSLPATSGASAKSGNTQVSPGKTVVSSQPAKPGESAKSGDTQVSPGKAVVSSQPAKPDTSKSVTTSVPSKAAVSSQPAPQTGK